MELRYELEVSQPNPGSFSYEDRDDLREKLTDLLEEAEQEPKKPGDESALTLTLTVKAVAASAEEKAVQDAEKMAEEQA